MGIFTHPSVEEDSIGENDCMYCGGKGEVPSEEVKGEWEVCRICNGTGKR